MDQLQHLSMHSELNCVSIQLLAITYYTNNTTKTTTPI